MAGSRADEVVFWDSAPNREMRRLRLFVPAVESRNTKDMNSTSIALLSRHVVSYGSKSLF